MPRRPRRACTGGGSGYGPATGSHPSDRRSSRTPSRPPEARLARPEGPDGEDRARLLLLRRPHGLDRQTDRHVLRRHLTELVHEADPPRGAVDLDHRGELRLLQGLHVPPDVADRERIHDAGVLDLHPPVGGTEALLAEHPRGDQDAPAPPALPGQDDPAPHAPEVLADGHARVPGVPGVDLPVDRAHGLTEGLVLQRGGPQGGPGRRAVVAIGLPTPRSPPDGVDGRSPSRLRTPSFMASGALPLSNSRSPSRWWSSL